MVEAVRQVLLKRPCSVRFGNTPVTSQKVPDVGLAPSAAWRARPHPLAPLGPLPLHQLGPSPPGALQKEPRGVGGRGKERAGREGVWL